jgi:tetratricopeptide (TPR) repeat protein
MQPDPDRDVRVFVSSTFRDMVAERDVLVRFIFPELRRRTPRLGVTLCEVDLRWGITAAEAQDGQVLRLCLAEIDRCLPFQICLLGDRYGWVDPDAAGKLAELAPALVPYADRSVTELEIRYGILNRAPTTPPICFFYFRAADPAARGDEDPSAAAQLEALKQEIRRCGHPVHENYRDAAELGALVLADLAGAIDRRFAPPADNPAAHRDWRSAVPPRVVSYIARARLDRALDRCARSLGQPVMLQGVTGAGKTTLLSHWLRGRLPDSDTVLLSLPTTWWDRVRRLLGRFQPPRPVAVIVFFAAAIDSSLHATELAWAAVATNLLRQLGTFADIDEPLPMLIAALPGTLGRWLAMAAAKARLLIVLDGLDEVLPEGAALDFLPADLPAGVRLVLSAAPAAFAERMLARGWQRMDVQPLSHRERVKMTRNYLAAYGKHLSPEQERRVLALRPAGNPLYLRTLLDQLRETGVFETLTEQVESFSATIDLPAMFDRALLQIQRVIDAETPGLAGSALALIASARRGLAEPELLELLGDATGKLPDRYWAPLHLLLEPYLLRVEGVIGFANRQARLAAERCFLPDAGTRTAVRRRLIDYFAARASTERGIEELPWLLASLEDWDALAAWLARPDLLAMALVRRPFDVASFWMLLLARSAHRPEAAYADLIAAPARDRSLAAAVAQLLGDIGLVGPALDMAERLAADSPDVASLVRSLGARIAILLELHRFTEAEPMLTRQIALCEQLAQPRDLALALDNLALARLEQGRAEEALTLQARAEPIHREMGNDRALAVSFGVRATALFRLGQSEAAVAQWRRQETQARLVGDPRCLAASLGNQARVLALGHQFEAADPLSLEQERLCRRINDRFGLQLALSNRALVYCGLDRFDEALAALDERMAIADQLGDVSGRISALVQRAMVFHQLQDDRSAATLLARAREAASGRERTLPFETRQWLEEVGAGKG